MNVIMYILKLFITFLAVCIILIKLKNEDTSVLHGLILKNKSIINKFFSPTQLGEIEVSFKKLNIPYNTVSVFGIFITGLIISVITFFVCKNIFPLISVSLIISIPFILSPFWMIKYISNKYQERLEAELNDFFIQLKSALKINSDIIEALRRIQNITLEPFAGYTKLLLTEVNAGKLPEKALENFAQKVNIKKFTLYINNVRYCHIYGGDIVTLTDKTQNTISEAIKQKRKRIKETNSICFVLYLLIFIDIYMYFVFINGNAYYLEIMVNSFVGNIILNINFISIWGILWLSKMVKKLDY